MKKFILTLAAVLAVGAAYAGSLFTDITSHYPPDIVTQANTALDAIEDHVAADVTVANGTGVTSAKTTANSRQVVLTIDLTGDNTITLADGDHGAGSKLCDLPSGVIDLQVAVADLTVTNTANFNAAADDDFLFAIGTAEAGDDNDLTSTEADVIAKQTIDTDSGGTLTRAVEAYSSSAPGIFDGTTTAVALYANAAIADTDNDAANEIGVSGTLTVTYTVAGDY